MIITVVIDEERLARLDALLRADGNQRARSQAIREAIDMYIAEAQRHQRIMALVRKHQEAKNGKLPA